MKNLIVFTDLDGTLLDANTYSFANALKAITILRKRKIPIIPCTSKTHLEVLETQQDIGVTDPFIVENGSAVFFEKGYFPDNVTETEIVDGYQVKVLGEKYKDILYFFIEWRRRYNLSVTGFHEMTVEQVIDLTGLDFADADLAKKRFFSEPFIVNGKMELPPDAIDDIQRNGFRLLRGNRFYHLLGHSDKGTAVKQLVELYKIKRSVNSLTTIGIGDSMNDLELLRTVDKPVLVKKSDGSYQSGMEVKNLLYTEGIGPAGWQEAVFKLLKIT